MQPTEELALTESEKNAIAILKGIGATVRPIQTEAGEGQRTPDYIVRLNGVEFVVEVKEITHNVSECSVIRSVEMGEICSVDHIGDLSDSPLKFGTRMPSLVASASEYRELR